MLAQGDLKLLALALIAQQPRHGYELIKLIEEKTAGWYSPSPGVVYPTLTFLEEAGYVTAEADGAKKRYAITLEGQAYLNENREFADSLLGRLAEIGQKMSKVSRWMGRGDEEAARPSDMPRLVGAALENLREAAQQKLDSDRSGEMRIVEILARAANEIRGN
ncbi:MAG: PadR family transcriptional regulator [Rhizobiales bacterium 32-66-8]|nr:MAG: PadR family transcriptional regulator [Rhizobiales bacterium 32-66-8]